MEVVLWCQRPTSWLQRYSWDQVLLLQDVLHRGKLDTLAGMEAKVQRVVRLLLQVHSDFTVFTLQAHSLNLLLSSHLVMLR